MEFVFYGHSDSKVRTVAVCNVVGGPAYDIGLAGESSAMGYKLDRTEIAFGPMELNQADLKEITLSNTGLCVRAQFIY